MSDFADSSVSSNEATSDLLEDEAFHKDDDKGKKVTTVDEFTKVTDNQDFMGTLHISITEEEKTFTDEEKRGGELPLTPSATSFPESTDRGLSETVRDVGGRLLPVNTTGAAFERCRRDKKKIKVVKVGDGIILLPDNGADRMTIREACNPSDCGERPKLSEEFGDKCSLKRLDVTLSRTADDTPHARYIPTGSQACDTSKEDPTKKKEDAVFIENVEADNEFTPSLDNDERRMVIPEDHAPLQMRISETDFPSEHGEQRISYSEGPSEQGGLDHLDVILYTASEIPGMDDFTAAFPLDGKTEGDFNTKKTESENSKGGNGKDEMKSSIDDEKCRAASFQDTLRGLPQPKQSTEEQQEMDGDAVQAVDFSVKDVLCFAWQIAKGMVSAQIKNILDP